MGTCTSQVKLHKELNTKKSIREIQWTTVKHTSNEKWAIAKVINSAGPTCVHYCHAPCACKCVYVDVRINLCACVWVWASYMFAELCLQCSKIKCYQLERKLNDTKWKRNSRKCGFAMRSVEYSFRVIESKYLIQPVLLCWRCSGA